MPKPFSSTSVNRENYDTMLQSHRCLPTNQLQHDLNGTRIAAKHELLRSCLRAKRGMHECCSQLNAEPFLTEEEWKHVMEFEAALRETSHLTTICQNEEKLNSACGPVMRGRTHDRLSSNTMMCMDVDNWSSKNLLETEGRHFNNRLSTSMLSRMSRSN